MEYRVLGKLEVFGDGESVDLGAFRQRALLALLLTAPNTVFSTDQIIDGLWGDDVGSDRQNALWVHISGLRKALEPDREKRTEGTIVLTRAPGYLVAADPDTVDAVRFERLVTEGRSLAPTDPAAASLVLGEALALWRGRAYEDFTYETFAQGEIARLEGLRLEAVEARIDADLQRGMARELISELETLIREHPLQERLTGQLMEAMYRSGRQADALRAYQMLKARLGEELGIEPGTQIRHLEEQIVTGDPALDTGARTTRATPGAQPGLAVRGYELREKIGEGAFGVAYRAYQPTVGREVAIKVIRPELADDPNFIRRFEAEAQLVARLEHPHIVPLYDYWREPGAAYLVMRLMKGGNLAQIIESSALSAEQTDRMAEQLSDALRTAHRAGVVHRDIKPANILIDDEANAYLSDFGIAVGADGGSSDDPSIMSTLGAPYASPEQLDRRDITPTSDIYSLGVVVAQALTGLTGDVAQIRGALPPGVLRVVDRATDVDPDRRFGDVDAFADALSDALGTAGPAQRDIPSGPLRELDNPYKGLRSFDAADAGDFHGRERLVDRLVARLGEPGTRGRFIVVVGPSGGGKSSVVKAGLVPAIRRGALPLSGSWFTIEMTPAPHPFEALEEALLGVAIDPPASLLEQLADDNGLQRAAQRVLPQDGSQLLLVIDQLEELFTQVDTETANQFLDVIVSAITDEHSRIRVVATLRADFYDRPLRYRRLGELLREGTEVITPMTPDELERAITAPVEPCGITFEPALVAELVRDVVDRAGALPLLQYTLTELFEGRQGARITGDGYRQIGGVSGALVKRAEGLFAGLGEQPREVARQVFLRLVTLGEGAGDTRRRVLESELEELSVDRKYLRGVLDTFGRHRLLSFDRDPITRGPTVEISHEALLTEWTRLREWIDGARHDVRNQRRLALAMDEWVAADRGDEYLLSGGQLDQLRGWAISSSLPLSDPEQQFLATSVAEAGRVADAEREREARAVEAERQARRRFRQLAALGVVAAIVGGLAIWGLIQQRAATDAKRDVDGLLVAANLARSSQAALIDDPELALLLAVEAVHATTDRGFATEEAVDSIHWALQEMSVPYDVEPNTPVAVRVGPRGRTGVYALSPASLVDAALSATPRRLTDDECATHLSAPCPRERELSDDLPIFGGLEAYEATEAGGLALAGTRVTVHGSWNLAEGEGGLTAEFAAFEERTGIRIDYELGSAFRILEMEAAGQRLPDVLAVPQPGAVAGFARDQRFHDLSRYLDMTTYRADFGDYLASFATLGSDGSWPASEGSVHAVPIDVDLKGLVYYPKAAFDAAGYRVPETYDELIELSHDIVADGGTPWCVGFFAGAATGWPGTDLLESLVIRVGGIEAYDQWAFHETSFDDAVASEAGALLQELLFEPEFVRLGPQAITNSDFLEQLSPMLRRDRLTGALDPQCWLHHSADWMLGQQPADAQVGVDLDVFLLPPIDSVGAAPVTGGGNLAGALWDRPEVRALVEFMASPEWGSTWAQEPGTNSFLSPNRRFDASNYVSGTEEASDAVRVALGTEAARALSEGVWRFDASDLMPGAIGAFGPDGPGAFWTGMIDFADGVRSIDQVLTDIEAAWVALEDEEPD